MNIERERFALRLLEDALGWPPDEREQRLAEQLIHDPRMLTEIRELLKAAAMVAESMPTAMDLGAANDDASPPERLGAFRLGELLGTGGMGRVYRAERADGVFEQTVAIKVMRKMRLPGLAAEQFARERQILARLQHRNIAQLFDGAVTPEGHSYFVMELVRGLPVTQYVVEKKLPLRSTLQLFLQICSAVQYAHARLVVHADIKPSNVIVTEEGLAKLLDFGVAQVVAEADARAAQSRGLTYDYASPARQAGEPPSTVDDVYSLGVLLADMLQHSGSIPADLQSIYKRARAADPEKRYASVDALQEDVGRWLDDLPVVAHPAERRYTAGKFVVRHRFWVAFWATKAVVLISAAISLTVLYVRAEHTWPILENSVALRHQLWDREPTNWGLARDYAMALATLADAQVDAGQVHRACENYNMTVATFDSLRAAGHLAKFDEDHSLRPARERLGRHCR